MRRRSNAFLAVATALTLTLCAQAARAEGEQPEATPPAVPESEAGRPAGAESTVPPDGTPLLAFPPAGPEGSLLRVTPIGYLEAHYAWNFNRPANNITNYRGYENRHNSFTLANAALGALWDIGPVSGKLLLQVGNTPSTYYNQEPNLPGAGAANATGPELWKYLQEAYVTYKAPLGTGLKVSAGLMATPIGLEKIAVKDNWNWSRSNLFFGLPKYHAGVRAAYDITERLTATVSVVNGWNSVVDNNDGKSVEGHVTYRIPDRAVLKLLYFGGVERASNAPEGQYWRHHFDATGEVDVTSWLQVAAQADYGFEQNRIGDARWFAGAAAARVKPCNWLFVAVRGDRFYEHLATDANGRRSTPLFWNGVEWVSSATATLDVRPHSNVSFRLEFRHDQADGLLYYTGDTLVGDGSVGKPFVTNARRQQTLLIGATAWF